MSENAIVIENLSKCYLIGHRVAPAQMLRDIIGRKVNNFARKAADVVRGRQVIQGDEIEEFWALKDVSFEVKQGEVLGIIGRNGAGKTTLLKVLSRITEPTKGRVSLRGRVASLLEVGTGFHPELTGRENIFLNGAVLGMTQREIRKKFDEIVAFAEVEQFLDTPVKHYSSGMYVRLAFAVAAHLEPDILIVDEVLAVGDAEFQKKCLGKMDEVSRTQGRTVLLVSHNIQAITNLCSSSILFHQGSLIAKGPTESVVERYLSFDPRNTPEAVWNFADAPSTEVAKLRAVRVLDENKDVQSTFDMTKPIILQTEFWVLKQGRLTVSFWLYNSFGVNLFATANYQKEGWSNVHYELGLYTSWCTIPAHYLNDGKYYIKIIVARGNYGREIELNDVVSFTVNDQTADHVAPWAGLIRPLLPWNGERIGDLPK